MRQLIERAKSAGRFKDKDIEFRAYFDNLEQIKNETVTLQANSAAALSSIERLLKQGTQKLDLANRDLKDLNSKVQDLGDLYANHEANYQELRQRCVQAEQKAQSLAVTAQNWKGKLAELTDGLAAYEAVTVYERIAEKLNAAHANSVATLKTLKTSEAALDTLAERATQLKTAGDALAERAESQLNTRSGLESEYTRLDKLYRDLEGRSRDLDINLAKVDNWMNRTITSDAALTGLKQELDEQQSELDVNELRAGELVRKIQSLDALRESLPKPAADLDDELEQQQQPQPKQGEQLLKSIETSIENLRTQAPAVSNNVKRLLENNDFNADLERIGKEIYELKMLIDSTRQIANDIKVRFLMIINYAGCKASSDYLK
jgi:chromosome segregation ATPase